LLYIVLVLSYANPFHLSTDWTKENFVKNLFCFADIKVHFASWITPVNRIWRQRSEYNGDEKVGRLVGQ